jgi:hypothetical protein
MIDMHGSSFVKRIKEMANNTENIFTNNTSCPYAAMANAIPKDSEINLKLFYCMRLAQWFDVQATKKDGVRKTFTKYITEAVDRFNRHNKRQLFDLVHKNIPKDWSKTELEVQYRYCILSCSIDLLQQQQSLYDDEYLLVQLLGTNHVVCVTKDHVYDGRNKNGVQFSVNALNVIADNFFLGIATGIFIYRKTSHRRGPAYHRISGGFLKKMSAEGMFYYFVCFGFFFILTFI